jgi:cytochrome P450
VAVEDIEVDGEVIRAGDGVFLLISSANRDDAAFPLADTFDVRRPARDHLAFGHGVHVCLGQWLARAELEIVFTRLFRRLPGLALAVPIDDVPFKYDMTVFGVHSLPVQW